METANLKPDSKAHLDLLITALQKAKICYEILSHTSMIVSAEEGVEKGLGNLSSMAPTFILATEKGYLAAIIRGDTRISYKKIKKHFGLKNISLAGTDVVQKITGSVVGAVSLIQPELETIVDQRLLEMDVVYGGCGTPYFTLKIGPKDLVSITGAQVFDFTEMKIGN
jgi:prolyl-tRNA editing enzyme YbaK/EbsC (Cys-tRNA(Pro) deacylase)